MASLLRVTNVRYDEPEARKLLNVFVFGGHFGTDRPPRGILPALISEYIRESVHASADADVYAKTLHLLRFYEQDDPIPNLLQSLQRPLEDSVDLLRACHAIQAAADVGTPTEALVGELVDFFDQRVIVHEQAPLIWPVLMETRLVLTPHGCDDPLAARIDQEVQKAKAHEYTDEASMMAFDKIAAVQRNELPRSLDRAALKSNILAEADETKRRTALVDMYLGRLYAGDVLEIWAARQLRMEAYTQTPAPVLAALEHGIDTVDPTQASRSQAELELVRAAQAVIYLGGTLTLEHRKLYERSEGVANFLWDDE